VAVRHAYGVKASVKGGRFFGTFARPKVPKRTPPGKVSGVSPGRPSGNLQLAVSDGSDMKISYPRDYPHSPELFQGGRKDKDGAWMVVRVCSAAAREPVTNQTRQGFMKQTTANRPSSLSSARIGRSGVEGWCKRNNGQPSLSISRDTGDHSFKNGKNFGAFLNKVEQAEISKGIDIKRNTATWQRYF